MSFSTRPLSFAYFRLFAVILVFAIGILCLLQPVLEMLLGYSMIPADNARDHNAIMTGVIVSGLLGVVYGFMLLRIMTDRRVKGTDRRKRQAPIDFPDRRSGRDRRTGEAWSYPEQ